MLTTEQILLLFFSTILLIGLSLYLWLRTPPPLERLPPRAQVPPVKLPSVTLKWMDDVPFHESAQFINQPEEWRRRMLKVGQTLNAAGVKQIYFLHGTFTGSDPFNVLPPFKSLMPQLAQQWEQMIESKMKRAVDILARDIGNFSNDYVQLVEDATGKRIPCHTLHWSSANHHWGRLQGALRLIEDLHQRFPNGPEGRILLIGHSHARQVFALFTQLLTDSTLGQDLWKVIEDEQLGTTDLPLIARQLSHGHYDFVTLGGPLRYPLAMTDRMRFLHLVNHRGKGELAENMLNLWTTAGGDYVQQWGCHGSDTLATTHKERVINRKLDALLGKGIDTRVWVHTVATRLRVGDVGQTLLIDYGDQGGFRINCLPTVFGHGIYTRGRVMLFNMELICRYFYE
ncbi:hypothetical protein [Oligoflexus tunisiensis]|uniref:hypothetical protein n=1 Tax=Oligoflexus tunisiensis TaxID=708132 RepID=UPI00114D2DCA|nr:hypothetical protein [Oligoflexus tunisiensis]